MITARAGEQFAICRVAVEAGADTASIESVTAAGSVVRAVLHCEEPGAVAVCSVYDRDGKPVGTVSLPIDASQTAYDFDIGSSAYAYAKVFLLDGAYRPLCEGMRSA